MTAAHDPEPPPIPPDVIAELWSSGYDRGYRNGYRDAIAERELELVGIELTLSQRLALDDAYRLARLALIGELEELAARDAADRRAHPTNVVDLGQRPRADVIEQLRDDLERLDATVDELGELE